MKLTHYALAGLAFCGTAACGDNNDDHSDGDFATDNTLPRRDLIRRGLDPGLAGDRERGEHTTMVAPVRDSICRIGLVGLSSNPRRAGDRADAIT